MWRRRRSVVSHRIWSVHLHGTFSSHLCSSSNRGRAFSFTRHSVPVLANKRVIQGKWMRNWAPSQFTQLVKNLIDKRLLRRFNYFLVRRFTAKTHLSCYEHRETCSPLVGFTDASTVVQNSHELSCKYWANRSFVRSFTSSLTSLIHSLALHCSLCLRAPLFLFIRWLAYSLLSLWESWFF